MNEIVSLYRKYLADTGQQDDSTDYDITQKLGDWAARSKPELFQLDPTFGQEYGAIREANAGSLSSEFGRALKSGSQGLASTALGGAALLTGSDYLREKAQSFDADAAANAPTVGTLEDIAPGRSGIGSLFSKDTARYAASKLGSVVPSIAEAGVTALAGSAIGSAIAPGPGTVAGAAEGIVARGLIKSAIRSMLKKGVAEELVASGVIPEASEVALEQAVKQAVPKVTDLVGREAMAIGAKRGLAVTNLANSYLLNAGDVYSEGADRPTTLALGLISAIPDSILPTYVVGRLFPGVATSKAVPLAKAFLGDRATKLLKAAGIVGVEGGTEYFQEAVDVVARNLKEGKDALTFTPADYKRFREAGIAGAFGGALAAPTEFIEAPKPDTAPPPVTPPAPAAAPAPTPVASVPVAPVVPATVAPTELAPVAQANQEAENATAARLLQEQQAAIDQAQQAQVARQQRQAGNAAALAEQARQAGLAMVGETPEAIAQRQAETAGRALVGAPSVDLSNPEQAAQLETQRLGREMAGNVPPEVATPIAPEPQKNFLPAPASASPDVFGSPEKRAQVQAAIQIPGITYQYSLFKLGEGIPDYAQIDIVNPEGTNSIASTNLDQLRALGVNLPAIPASLPQGKYTVEQVRAATPSPAPAVLPPAQPAEIAPAAQDVPAVNAGVGGAASGVTGAENVGAQVEVAKGKGKRFGFGPRPDGTIDIIDAIQQLGGVPRKPAGETGGEWDGHTETFKGSARILVRPKSARTTGIDQFLGDLVASYPEFSHLEKDAGAFYSAVDAALAERLRLKRAMIGEQTTASQGAKFTTAAIEGEGRAGRGGKPVNVDTLNVGQALKVQREPVEVEAVSPDDGSVTLRDGPRFGTQTVPAGTVIIPDKGSLKKPKSGDYFTGSGIETALPASPDAVVPKPAVAPAAVPFEAGKVVQGEPSLDFRNTPLAEALIPEQWVQTVQGALNKAAAQGFKMGSHESSKADTRIAVALQAPDGRVIVTGVTIPSRTLDARGATAVKEPTLQRMGVDDGGKRMVQPSGNKPALLREVVQAGYKPLAVLHFDAEPGKIHQTFADQQAFDKAWGATEKTTGRNIQPAEIRGNVTASAQTEAQLRDQIEKKGDEWLRADPVRREELRQEIRDLYTQLDRVTAQNQQQTGDQGLPPEYRRGGDAGAAIEAGKSGQFNTVMANLMQLGAKVDLVSREILAQNTAQELQRRYTANEQEANASTDPLVKRELARRNFILLERMQAVGQASGVTYSPWHFSLAMKDIGNASMDEFVTLLHEASENLTMRLTVEQRGSVQTAIGRSLIQLRGRQLGASQETNVRRSSETGHADLLAETLAQEFAAAGIPDAPSLAQAIVRWVKDLYYRAAMALQAGFGAQPSPEIALKWFENQLAREVGGDFQYRFANLLDQYLPSPLQERVRRFEGRTGTPGGVSDFLDPVSGIIQQPGVETLNRNALDWDMQFRTATNAGAELDIPDPEARARMKGAVINGLLDFYTNLKEQVAPDATWEDFFIQIKRSGEEDPKLLLGALEQKFPGSSAAQVGGERMTAPMNREAQVELWSRFRKFGLSLRRKAAQATKSIAEASKQVTENAQDINRMEADLRNASLHEDRLRLKAKELVRDLAQSFARGRDTAELQGSLVEAIRQEEKLTESDPIPDAYRQVLGSLYDGTTPVFDYIRAIAQLDLPLSEMTTAEVVRAIKGGGELNPALANLGDNRPLMVALATLARKNADQVDQIQLGWLRDTSMFRQIHGQLEEIKGATAVQLRELDRQFSEHGKASGLAARLKGSYLSKRRKQQAASDRVARAEERQALFEKALGPVDQRTETAAQDAGGAQYEWAPEEGAKWTAMRQDEEGNWRRTERTLHFNPDGSAVEGDQLRQDLASNLAWLRARAAEAGKPRYNQIASQTYALQLLDAKGQQQRTWNGAILNGIDRFVKTPIATVRGLGGPAMQRVIQMLNRYQFIQRNYQRSLEAPATEWQHEFVRLRNSSGLKDNGDFIAQVYKPAMYFLAVNPGLEEGPAIRQAAALARRSLANPAEDFNDRFASFLRKTKETEDKLLAVAEQYGVFVADKRLGPELRRAVARGWLTGMRSLNGGLVDVLTKDMAQAGWKQDTFSVIDPANAPDKAARDQSFEILGQTETLQPLLARLFTPAIIGQWLEPFIAKPGQEPFSYGGDAIPQASVQEAWAEAKGDVLGWIDELGRKLDLQPDKEGHDPVALFRLSMLRNLNSLYNHEAKLAADASQVPGLLDPHGPKPHALMDARVSDLLPPEHVEFAAYEPETMHRLVARVAYHGAFGRNATHIQQAFRETMNHLQGQQAQFQTLASLHTSKAGRVAEAVARGWNYAELESASRRYRDAKDFQTQLESVLGVSANSGPLGDFQKGMALLNFVSGQIVDNPKTAAYNLLSPAMRPFAQRSLGPTAISNTVRTYADILQTGFGSLFESMGLHLFKAGRYAQTIGNSEGRAFSNLPYGVVLSDIGHAGDNQAGANKWMVKPLRLARNLQRKGVQLGAGESQEFPRLSIIPGLGVMNSISQIEVQAGGARLAQEFEQLVKDGADYFASHPDAANNPNFRFKPSDLYHFKLDYPLFDWWRQKSVEYGLGNIEDVVRDSAKRRAEGPNANLLTEDQAVTLSMMNQNEFNGNSSINTTPAWLMTNTFLRMAMPLMRWPLWMMSAVHEAAKPRAGENAVKPMLRAIGTLALWNLPIGLAFSLLMDEYDKKLLGKKSNLPNLDKRAAIPLIGLPLSLLTSDHPISQLESMLVRSARAGNIYGLGADVAAQTFAGLDPSTGQRAFSLDQRVLAYSQLANLGQALKNYKGQGFATWGSVAKPVIMAIGGNGVLHAVDLANNLLGLDNAESRLTERSASSNWIRSAAQELDIPIKAGGGFAGVPTPMSGYTREMYLAALANDRVGFLDNYRRALNAAREAVAEDSSVPGVDREKEAAQRVLASWKSRNPMGVLATKPTDVQVRQILSIMEPEGQQSVRDALSRFDTFTTMIAPSPIDRYFNRQLATQRSQMNPDTIARRAAGGSLLFSTR